MLTQPPAPSGLGRICHDGPRMNADPAVPSVAPLATATPMARPHRPALAAPVEGGR
jgi:hypothetical protein